MVLSCRKLLSKTSTRVLNPFDVFILIALFSHFEEDVHKQKLAMVQYSRLFTRESKHADSLKKRRNLFGLVKKQKGAIFNKLQHNSPSDTMLNQLSVIEP